MAARRPKESLIEAWVAEQQRGFRGVLLGLNKGERERCCGGDKAQVAIRGALRTIPAGPFGYPTQRPAEPQSSAPPLRSCCRQLSSPSPLRRSVPAGCVGV